MRQRDPISPYHFVIVMEVFSCQLAEASLEPQFQFHPKCDALGLSHLCFADDVLIFSRADIHSLQKIKTVPEDIDALSGLRVNPSKSHVFYFGVSTQ